MLLMVNVVLIEPELAEIYLHFFPHFLSLSTNCYLSHLIFFTCLFAAMTATLRRIDLATQILAPIATGFIMSFIGIEFGALFIGSWNVLSVIAEYYLLWKVYNTVPSLRKMKDLRKSEGFSFFFFYQSSYKRFISVCITLVLFFAN